MLRFGLFDLDDTLYAPGTGLWSAIGDRIDRYLVERIGLPADRVHTVRREYFETYGTTLNGLRAQHQVDPIDYLAFVHDVPLENYLQPSPTLDALLTRLPVEKVIFTNSDAPHALRVVNRLGIAHHFKTIVDIHALAYANKPEPGAYKFVLDQLGAQGEECFFVDDSPRNLQPAKLLGMWAVLVTPGPTPALAPAASAGASVTARIARVDAVIPDILDLEAALALSGRLAPPVLPEAGAG